MCNTMKMPQLFTMEDGVKQNVLIEQNIDTNGNIVMVSGKVVSFLTMINCFAISNIVLGPPKLS